MAYLVLARKYRPQKFSELVGQDHVTQTLRNAFKQNKVAQAYLFTGTRGIGKTSVARILAKALRCDAPNAQPGEANYGEPCNECVSCKEVGLPNSLDVIEIDGASNNGVDNVRDIRENVKFMPARGRMKVFIIDEVHMLTGAAFNALLKTLEEPPAHAAFIFATTEVHKVPATILSRCQRFDLKRVPQPLIFDYLMKVLKQEKIQAAPEALQIVARKAEGSVRDALSLLDQVIALSGKEITMESAASALGVVSRELTFRIVKAALGQREMDALAEIQAAFESGMELKGLAVEFADTVRNALLVKLGATNELIGILKDEREELSAIAESSSNETLQAAFQVLSQSVAEIIHSPLPRATLELTILRLSQLQNLSSVATLLKRLDALEAAAPGANRSREPLGVQPMNTTLGRTISPAPQAIAIAAAAPAAGGQESQEITWKNFVLYVTRHKASLGSLLEHAVPTTANEAWKTAPIIKIGFRDNQIFYFEQARSAAIFAQLENLLRAFVDRTDLKLDIEKLEKAAAQPQLKTLSEKKTETRQEKMESLKQKFLSKDIVRDTREIFGAEITGFDINTGKDND